MAKVAIHLNQYDDKESLKRAIRSLTHDGETTNTARAIRTMHKEAFTFQNGDRSDAQNIAIVLTDGNSTDEVFNKMYTYNDCILMIV